MKVEEPATPQTRQEQGDQAADRCQATSLCLRALSLSGLFWADSVERQAHAGGLARLERDQHQLGQLSRSAWMLLLGLQVDSRLIRAMMKPDRKQDSDPHVGKGANRDGMTLAFSSLALVVVPGPRLALGRLPGKLLQRITQGFDTAQTSMRLGVHPALIEDGRGSPQRLQAAGIAVAASIIPDLGQQSRGQALAGTWQALKDRMVLVGQKKGVNLLVILSNLLDQGQQLTDQRQQQARFGARGERIGLQVGLVQPLDKLARRGPGMRMLGVSEHLLDLLCRSGYGGLWGGIGLQEPQRALLLQFAKQLQGHRIIDLEAGGELVDQPCLHLDQAVLIARELLEFSHLLAVWRQAVQIGQVCPSGLGQQVGIDRIGLSSRGGSPTINGARIDRIDRPAGFQQVSNQQPMGGLDDAGHLVFGLRADDLFQEGVQSAQAFWTVSHPKRANLAPPFIKDQRVMVVIGPVNADIPHPKCSSLQTWFLSTRALILWQTPRDSLMIGPAQERGQGSASFLNRSSRGEKLDFPWRVQRVSRTSLLLFQPCVERACS
jgi:hypothetical protein